MYNVTLIAVRDGTSFSLTADITQDGAGFCNAQLNYHNFSDDKVVIVSKIIGKIIKHFNMTEVPAAAGAPMVWTANNLNYGDVSNIEMALHHAQKRLISIGKDLARAKGFNVMKEEHVNKIFE